MRYLLDVNVLLAMRYEKHVHYARVDRWVAHARELASERPPFEMATCAITELGFVRIACGVMKFASNVSEAQADLRALLQSGSEFIFVGDRLSALQLPDWTRRSAQTTDGHLIELAREHGLRLLTLDESIPGAELIPHLPREPMTVREEAFLEASMGDEAAIAAALRGSRGAGLWLA
jgi:predicted nucleic acid-binding protein